MNPARGHPTRIAMDVTALLGEPTGVGTMVGQLAGRLPGLDPDVSWTGYVVSVRGRSELDSVIPSGWRPYPLPYPARLAHRLWRSVGVPTVSGFDLVHGPNYVVPPAADAARLVTVHDLTAWRFPEMVDNHSRYYPEHLRRAVDGGAHVHVVSDFVRAEVEEELGIEPERVHLVRNGYADRGAEPGDPARGRSIVGAPYVLSIGTVEPRKDHRSLVHAMAEVWLRSPDVRLAIVGMDGWGAAELDSAIERVGGRDRVVRLGYVDETTKRDLLAGAEVMAFPSRYEGFGLPILEAMGADVPVVSTDAGAIPEVAGGAALLVDPADSGALAEAIETVLHDTALADRLITAGRANVSRFSWDRAAEELMAVYHKVLAASGRRPGVGIAGDRSSDLGGSDREPGAGYIG